MSKSKKALRGPLTIYPTPVVLASCERPGEKPNIITLAWAGVVCSSPEMIAIAIRPERHSFSIIKDTGEFVINIPRASQVRQVDLCGIHSGKDLDKFELCSFTPIKGKEVNVPLIAECPVNLECKVRNSIHLGCHNLFLGEIVAKHIDADAIDAKGAPMHAMLEPIAYVTPNYYELDHKPLGHYGYSR